MDIEKNTNYTIYMKNKEKKIEKMLLGKEYDIQTIRMMSWGGLPKKYRPIFYRVMLNTITVEKRSEEIYSRQLEKLYKEELKNLVIEEKTRKQISIDVERLSSANDLPVKQRDILIEILLLYTNLNIDVGYVQAMADILFPFSILFREREIIFYTFNSFMSKIKMNFFDQQQGTEKLIEKMKVILEKLDKELFFHLKNISVDFRVFSFRWFNCFFARELNSEIYFLFLDCLLTMNDYNSFAIYFAVELLRFFRKILLETDCNIDCVLFLQNISNIKWKFDELLLIFGNIYINMSIYN